MLVSIAGFGSIWRARVRETDSGSQSVVKSTYYNTTGVPVRGVIRQRPVISGFVRFNGDSGLDPNYPGRSLESVFECAEPCIWKGENKLLLTRKVTRNEAPDRFLVVLDSALHGVLPVGKPDWRSRDTWLISLSEHRRQQEALVLVSPKTWFRTSLGLWLLETPGHPAQCRLHFLGTAPAIEVR